MNPQSSYNKMLELCMFVIIGFAIALGMFNSNAAPFNRPTSNGCNCDRPRDNDRDTPHRRGTGSTGSTGEVVK